MPSNPSLYEICISTHGFSYSPESVSHVIYETIGVVMLTFWLSSELKVVAAVPMLMLETSPNASSSSGVSLSSTTCVDAPDDESSSDIPLSNALISSCDSIPSILYSLLLSQYLCDTNCIIIIERSGQCRELSNITYIYI